jgi:hypothetical protein
LFILFVTGMAPLAEAAHMEEPLTSLCQFERSTQVVESFHDIPQPIRQFLLEKFSAWGGIGFAKDEVELTDVIIDPSLKRRLFRGAAQSGGRWAVWYLRGGEWIGLHAALFELTQDGARLALTRNTTTMPGAKKPVEGLCAGVKRFLAGSSDTAGAWDAGDMW